MMQEENSALRLRPMSLLLAALFLVAVAASVFLLLDLISVLITLLLAIVFAEAIRPPVARLEQKNVPRSVAILLLYLIILGVLGASLALVLPPFVEQLRALAREAPGYRD